MQLQDVWRHRLRLQESVADLNAGRLGFTQPELALVQDEMGRDNDSTIVLFLIAAAESALQQRAHDIANGSESTPFALQMKAVFAVVAKENAKRKAKGMAERTPNLRDILNVWREDSSASPGAALAVDDFIAAQDVRHWLAHGRQWKAPILVDAMQSWARIAFLFRELGIDPPTMPTSLLNLP